MRVVSTFVDTSLMQGLIGCLQGFHKSLVSVVCCMQRMHIHTSLANMQLMKPACAGTACLNCIRVVVQRLEQT